MSYRLLAPALVDDLEQQVALQRAHELLAELVLALAVHLERVGREHVHELGPLDLFGRELRRIDLRGEQLLDLREQAGNVPVLDESPGVYSLTSRSITSRTCSRASSPRSSPSSTRSRYS